MKKQYVHFTSSYANAPGVIFSNLKNSQPLSADNDGF